MLRLTRRRFVAPAAITRVEHGLRFAEGWKINFTATENDATLLSPWHHVDLASPLGPNVFRFVNEIPKGQREKLEIATKVPFNPIQQDRVKKTGYLRSFTYGDIPFNYGCLPQTWEDPACLDADTGCRGDGDPIDVVELSGIPLEVGSIVDVRVLGVVALIDEGETDWKVLAVRSDREVGWKQLTDVPRSVIDSVIHWFRYYKTTDGKPENQFAFGGDAQSADKALEVIVECQSQYSRLLRGETSNPGLWLPPQREL